MFFFLTGRKQIGLLLTLGVRSCSFESSLPDIVYWLGYTSKIKNFDDMFLLNALV